MCAISLWSGRSSGADGRFHYWQRKPVCRSGRKRAGGILAYHNGIYATGLIEGRLTKEMVTKTSGDIQFRQDTIDEVNTTLKNINDIATATGLTGTPGIIVMPVKGATEENTTVFSGMTESESSGGNK
jgi:hypothetical protein